MAIELIVSNDLNSLANTLSERIKTKETVFDPVYVITQTDGMNAWLRSTIAQNIGIAANIQFLKPNDIIHAVYRILGGNFLQSIAAHDMNWLLYKLLGERSFIEKHRKVSAYYDTSASDKDIKRMALAEKIADLFDQYQVYRTDLIEQWNRGEGEEHWQKELWIKARNIAAEDFPDKTMVGKFILDHLNDQEKIHTLKKRIPNVYFFGLSLITEFHLKIFYAIGEHIDFCFLMQNPSPHDYWFEDKSEKVIDYLKQKSILAETEKAVSNPLLTSWGKLIQDTFMMLFQNEESLNQYEVIEVVEPKNDTLLHAIQQSIFNNEKDEIHFSEQLINDGSIQINACYSPVREVETLYNYLVHLVDQKEIALSARDIVIMVSDIDLYASYIRAIFDNAPYRFRYSIADESYVETDSISSTLLEILSLNENQFTSEKVMNLLNFTAIKKQFQIHDIMKMRDLISQSNIRFGIQGDAEDQTQYVSWQYGLKRIMYGLCMSGGEELGQGENSFFPLDTVEGHEMYEVVRLVHFVESLMSSVQKRKKKRTIAAWIEYVEETLTTFIGVNEEVQDEDYAMLLHQLEKYAVLEDLFDEKISFDIFQHSFLPSLKNAKKSGNFASGGITFCSLIPMRSIPFKVVGLLGMNFDQFPRIDRRLSFDLMLKERRRGDRNVKDNDKHLFLETLVSAQDYLYISYIGQNVKDNSSLPPSALIDELLDFISTRTDDPDNVRENFIQKHPLHGFSKKYNAQNPKLYNYLMHATKDTAQLTKTLTTDSQELNWDEIDLDQMIGFLKDPISGYYKRVLGIHYKEEEYTLAEAEPFELNHLQLWKMKTELMSLDEWNDYQNKQLKTGALPLKNMGEAILEKQAEGIEFAKQKWLELTENKQETQIDIHLKIAGVLLTGKLNHIYDHQMVHYVFSKNEAKYCFETYVQYLTAIAQGEKIAVYFISNAQEKVWKAADLTQKEAKEALAELIEIYKIGHREILPFVMDFMKDVKNLTDLDQVKFNKHVQEYFDHFTFPSDNAYHIKERANGLFDKNDTFEKFLELAERLMIKPTEIIYFKEQ